MVHIRRIAIAARPDGVPAPPGDRRRTQTQARAIIARIQRLLRQGRAFPDLARAYSDDPTGRSTGGDAGIVSGKSAFDAGLLAAALKLKKGQITAQPETTAFGLEMIQAVSTSADPLPSDRTHYAQAEQQVRRREIDAQLRGYVPALRARGKVIVYLTE